jgi:hypothetical protein
MHTKLDQMLKTADKLTSKQRCILGEVLDLGCGDRPAWRTHQDNYLQEVAAYVQPRIASSLATVTQRNRQYLKLRLTSGDTASIEFAFRQGTQTLDVRIAAENRSHCLSFEDPDLLSTVVLDVNAILSKLK